MSNRIPNGAVPVVGVFSGADTASSAASLAAIVGRVNYLAGFSVSGLGSTAGGPVSVTVAPVTNAASTLTYSYVFAASATTANTPLLVTFNPALPANATNTAITVTVPGQAGNTATQINLWGYAA